MAAAVARGRRVILSPANHAYLDMKYDATTPIGLSWVGYVPVSQAHDWDPGHCLSGVDESAVLGLEAPLWTDAVRSPADIEFLAMPRLAVLAELGWSPPGGAWDNLRDRLRGQEPLWTRLGFRFGTRDLRWERPGSAH